MVTTSPTASPFSLVTTFNRLCGILINRFYRLEIHSLMVCIFGQFVNCCPLEEGTKLYLCTVAPLLYLLSDILPPSLLPNVQYIQYRRCVTEGVGGGEVLKCTVDHILQESYTLFLTRFRTYKIASPPLTKLASKDDIKGLVSLKFFRP